MKLSHLWPSVPLRTILLLTEHNVHTWEYCNRFHAAWQQIQMASKCGTNKKVANKVIAKCVTDVPNTS